MGKTVSFAGLIGLMRFPYSSLRSASQLGCPAISHYSQLIHYAKGEESMPGRWEIREESQLETVMMPSAICATEIEGN